MRDDLNLYAYVGNNPVNRADPLGLSSQEPVLLACGVGCAGILAPKPVAPPVAGIPGMAGGVRKGCSTFRRRVRPVVSRM